jgi:GT2 family glycosyltransferase
VLGYWFGFFQAWARRDELYDEKQLASQGFSPDYAISACWFMPREVFEHVGFFDEHIFYAPEDVDFCIRLKKAGYTIAYCPSVKVLHHCQRVSYKNRSLALSHMRGLLYLFKKHRYIVSRERLRKTLAENTQQEDSL